MGKSIVAPQCPIHERWSTDNWFENFYEEITTKYRVDTNKDLKFTADPDAGHGMYWSVYPEQELYDWFLQHDKRMKNKNSRILGFSRYRTNACFNFPIISSVPVEPAVWQLPFRIT